MSSPLESAEAYLDHPTCGAAALCKSYRETIQDMLVKFQEHVFSHNEAYLNYVVLTGFRTVTRVFQMVFLYTNDLQLAVNQALKANSYFVEFVGQLGEDHHTFLRLDSRDACLFVYKKTIFSLNDDVRREFAEGEITRDYATRLTHYAGYVECVLKRLAEHGVSPGGKLAGRALEVSGILGRLCQSCEPLAAAECATFATSGIDYLAEIVAACPGHLSERTSLVETLAKRFRSRGNVFLLERLKEIMQSERLEARFATLDAQKFNDWLVRALQ